MAALTSCHPAPLRVLRLRNMRPLSRRRVGSTRGISRRLRRSVVPCSLIWFALTSFAFCEPEKRACPTASPYKYLRYDEDFTYLRNPECTKDALDAVKYIPFGRDGKSYLSLGGEIRENIEYFQNAQWGKGPQSPAYLLQRYMGHIDLHWEDRIRFFAQLKSGIEVGRNGGPRVFDEDKLDLNQAFVDIVLAKRDKQSVTLRAGRQELAYGSARLVSTREGPTVHQTFDTARLIFTTPRWRVDAFASKPVQTKTDLFDDWPDFTRTFWGLYTTGTLRPPNTHLDIYYFGLEHSNSKFQQGTARERRHSIGSRFWGTRGGLDYDVEPLLQFGTFGAGNILAWAVESDNGYTLRKTPLTPRVGAGIDIESGDRDPHHPDLQTFNPLFPRGLYHQLVNLTGHLNSISFNPTTTLHFTPRLSLTQNWQFIWRESLSDGIYGVGANFLRAEPAGNARYLGSQPTTVVNWTPQRHFSVIFIYTHFFPGQGLENTGPAKDVNHVSGWVDFKF